MNRFRPRRPSPSMAVALLALFVALGGGAYAATKLPKNSVGARQIKSNAVRSAKVKNRSLLAKDFRAGQLPRGPQGVRGLPGAPATRLWVAVNADGTIARRSSPSITIATEVEDNRPDIGDYVVDFGRDISACAPVGTIANSKAPVPVSGELLVYHRLVGTNYRELLVDTRTSNGDDTNGARPFTLALFC